MMIVADAMPAAPALYRDAVIGGPHQDQMIVLTASNSMEQEWVRMTAASHAGYGVDSLPLIHTSSNEIAVLKRQQP